MNLNPDTKNSPPKKLKRYKLKSFRFFSKNLPPFPLNLKPKTYPLATTAVGRGHLKPNLGFTLIELLVTLSLFVVLTIVVIFSQSKFNGSILLTNLAYDVALTVRQAQSYGVNVRETTAGSGEFKKAYGVHFDTTSDLNKKQFILFSDSDEDGIHGDSDLVVNTYKIKRGSYISDICVGSDCSISTLDITFLRPNPDAIIKCDTCGDGSSEATIKISSVDGKTRTVIVNATGQISIGRGM